MFILHFNATPYVCFSLTVSTLSISMLEIDKHTNRSSYPSIRHIQPRKWYLAVFSKILCNYKTVRMTHNRLAPNEHIICTEPQSGCRIFSSPSHIIPGDIMSLQVSKMKHVHITSNPSAICIIIIHPVVSSQSFLDIKISPFWGCGMRSHKEIII